MSLVLTSGPAQEPVTVSEAKAHLRIEGNSEDALIASLILTSRLHIEAALDLALITQSWTVRLDAWPRGDCVEIALSPLKSVDAVRVKDASGAFQPVPATSYLVDLASRPPRLVWNAVQKPTPGVRAGGIEIDITAGFGDAPHAVPAPLKHAVLLLVAHWYEHRDAVEIGALSARIPDVVSDLIQPFRKIRL